MANTSNLNLKNSADETFSNYTLIKNHADAIARINEKCHYELLEDDKTYETVDGTSYFIEPDGNNAEIPLPDAIENPNFHIFVKQIGSGGVKLSRETAGQLIDGVDSDLDLATDGDYVEIISSGTIAGYFTKYKYID